MAAGHPPFPLRHNVPPGCVTVHQLAGPSHVLDALRRHHRQHHRRLPGPSVLFASRGRFAAPHIWSPPFDGFEIKTFRRGEGRKESQQTRLSPHNDLPRCVFFPVQNEGARDAASVTSGARHILERASRLTSEKSKGPLTRFRLRVFVQ